MDEKENELKQQETYLREKQQQMRVKRQKRMTLKLGKEI